MLSNVPHSTLVNNGFIDGNTNGVQFDSGSASALIKNNADGVIKGVFGNGINVDGNVATITNSGAVWGAVDGIDFGLDSRHVTLNTSRGGEIFGADRGVFAASDFDGGAINNSGLIHSSSIGVSVFTTASFTTVINNSATGVIQGGAHAIETFAGRISLTNHGKIMGDIVCTAAANDAIANAGKITGAVHLGPGNDVFVGTVGTSGKVFGEAGNDKIIGSTSADNLDGGPGADIITGARGRDLLAGGTGTDHFDFNAIAETVVGAKRDVITDFNRTQHDRIDLLGIDANTHVGGNQAFHFIGAQPFHFHGTHHVYGELRYANHILQGDVNGDGHADFEVHVNVAALASTDFIL